MSVKIENSWKQALAAEFEKDYFKSITTRVKADIAAGITIYPAGPDIFRAFELCPFENVKVVLLGQDPYHGFGQAHGLCFSVQRGVKPPPSLVNIYKELQSDLGLQIPNHGNLSSWAQQGILMLNASLTVQANTPNSHAKIGWEQFTDAVISTLSARKMNLVFLLWGNFARQKKALIDTSKHLVLESAHPSPFSANSGFFGNKHFSKTNEYLISKGFQPIDWQV